MHEYSFQTKIPFTFHKTVAIKFSVDCWLLLFLGVIMATFCLRIQLLLPKKRISHRSHYRWSCAPWKEIPMSFNLWPSKEMTHSDIPTSLWPFQKIKFHSHAIMFEPGNLEYLHRFVLQIKECLLKSLDQLYIPWLEKTSFVCTYNIYCTSTIKKFNIMLWCIYFFLSKGIIFWIELPWP